MSDPITEFIEGIRSLLPDLPGHVTTLAPTLVMRVDPGDEPPEPPPPEEPETTLRMLVLDPDGNGRERLFAKIGMNQADPPRPIIEPAVYDNGNPAFIIPGSVVFIFRTEGINGVIKADGGGEFYMIATGTTSSNAYPNASGYYLPTSVLEPAG
jgi:hypothetical protein